MLEFHGFLPVANSAVFRAWAKSWALRGHVVNAKEGKALEIKYL
jgi:hypothetical protein